MTHPPDRSDALPNPPRDRSEALPLPDPGFAPDAVAHDGTPITCSAVGCRSRATHFPRVRVWAKGRPKDSHEPIALVVRMPLCRTCSRTRGWFGDEQRAWADAQITAQAPTFAARDWDRAELDAVAIMGGEHPYLV